MTISPGFKALATLLMVAVALVVAPPTARAGSYATTIHIDTVAGGGNYLPLTFHWGGPFELHFTHTTDVSTADLMQLAQSHQNVGTATLELALLGTATITLAMSDVRIAAVQEDGGSDGPVETVVLSFRSVTYTFQPLLANGQKAGPPVTIVWQK